MIPHKRGWSALKCHFNPVPYNPFPSCLHILHLCTQIQCFMTAHHAVGGMKCFSPMICLKNRFRCEAMNGFRAAGGFWFLDCLLSQNGWMQRWSEVKHLLRKESQESGNKILIIGLFSLRNYRTHMWYHVLTALSQQTFRTQLTWGFARLSILCLLKGSWGFAGDVGWFGFNWWIINDSTRLNIQKNLKNWGNFVMSSPTYRYHLKFHPSTNIVKIAKLVKRQFTAHPLL